jgi:hypothetical protein
MRKGSRARVAARKDVANGRYSSSEEVSEKEAKRILQEDRLIRNPRVVQVCVELGKVACRALRIPMNAYVFTHGIQKTLEAIATKKEVEPPQIEDIWEAGQRIRVHELRCEQIQQSTNHRPSERDTLMATNAELEKQVTELRVELAPLRNALDKTFRDLGCHEWVRFKSEAKEINAPELAASTINEIQEMIAATTAKG